MEIRGIKPLLIVISAPSGAGKTTLCDRLIQDYPEICYSISCTTRLPRGYEEDGVDYHFMKAELFQRHLRAGHFLEHAEVHGYYYGTLEEPVRHAIADNLCMLMDIDVEGAAQVRARVAALPADDPLHGALLDIFVAPPSLEVLRERLEGRGEDSAATIERRLRNAGKEMARAGEFRYRIVNDNLDVAYRDLCAIIEHGCGIERRAYEESRDEW